MKKNMKKLLFFTLLLVISFVIFVILEFELYPQEPLPEESVSSFQECIEKGYPVMESYPRQCRTPSGEIFTEDIGNMFEKQDLIRVSRPLPNDLVQSPLIVEGEARGYWFFEADFPVVLLDDNGDQLASGIATAQSDWMTEDFVVFESRLTFDDPPTQGGNLILKKDNPSGLPENDDQLRIPLRFEANAGLANPASVHCEEQGGTFEGRYFTDGVEGFCLFEDGSECPEWEFFRGECEKGERFCKDLCGDGECQETVCMAVGCPCAESAATCPQDCE